jgi:hypothetical protein
MSPTELILFLFIRNNFFVLILLLPVLSLSWERISRIQLETKKVANVFAESVADFDVADIHFADFRIHVLVSSGNVKLLEFGKLDHALSDKTRSEDARPTTASKADGIS